jgi:hypothetical protein
MAGSRALTAVCPKRSLGSSIFPVKGNHMNHAPRIACLAASLVMTMLGASALAQSKIAFTETCQNFGSIMWDPLGGRPSHGMEVVQVSCIVQGGPMDGAIRTAMFVHEFDNGVGVLMVGNSVYRKPGGMAVTLLSDDTVTVSFDDTGQPNGFTSTGKGVFKFTIGTFAPLAGKSFISKARSISGTSQGRVEYSLD